ncbi:hypothetical protein Tco_0700562 [Tanacetum coccineum]
MVADCQPVRQGQGRAYGVYRNAGRKIKLQRRKQSLCVVPVQVTPDDWREQRVALHRKKKREKKKVWREIGVGSSMGRIRFWCGRAWIGYADMMCRLHLTSGESQVEPMKEEEEKAAKVAAITETKVTVKEVIGTSNYDKGDTANTSSEQSKDRSPGKGTVLRCPILFALKDIDGTPFFLEKALTYVEDHDGPTNKVQPESTNADSQVETEEGKNNEEPSSSPTKVQTGSSVKKEVKALQEEERKRVAAKEREKSGLAIKELSRNILIERKKIRYGLR